MHRLTLVQSRTKLYPPPTPDDPPLESLYFCFNPPVACFILNVDSSGKSLLQYSSSHDRPNDLYSIRPVVWHGPLKATGCTDRGGGNGYLRFPAAASNLCAATTATFHTSNEKEHAMAYSCMRTIYKLPKGGRWVVIIIFGALPIV